MGYLSTQGQVTLRRNILIINKFERVIIIGIFFLRERTLKYLTHLTYGQAKPIQVRRWDGAKCQ